MRNRRSLQLGVIVGAALVHGWIVWTILRQPLDGHVPPITPRTPVWALYFDAVTSPGPGADFFAVYHAGIQASRGQTPYGRDESPQVTPYFYIFRYHPLVAATLGRIVVLWKPALAYRLWVLLVEATFISFVIAVARHDLPPWTRVVALVALLVQFPYFLELHMGQFTCVAAAVTGLTVLTLHRRTLSPTAAILAGVPLTVVSVIKPFPAFSAAGLISTGRGRIAAMTTVLATALLLSPLFTTTTLFREYAALNLVDDTTRLYPGNFSITYLAFATSVFAGMPFSRATVNGLSIAAGLTIAALVVVALARARVHDMRRTSGTLLATFFLAYFRVWEHHYTAVIVGAVLILVSLTPDERARPRLLGTLLVGLALLAAPTVFALLPADPRSWTATQAYLLPWPKIVGALCVVLVGVTARRKP